MFGWVLKAKAECAEQKAKALARSEKDRLNSVTQDNVKEHVLKLIEANRQKRATATPEEQAAWSRAKQRADQGGKK